MRTIIKATACLLGLGVAFPAMAEGYPERAVTMIVPYGAGGVTDTMARITAAEMEKTFGAQIAIVNKTGAAGTIGMLETARSRPDGYTISMIPSAPLVNQPHLRPLNYDVESFTYICQTFSSPQVLLAKAESDFKDLSEAIEYAKEHPNELTYGTAGPGTLPHIGMVQVLQETGAEMRHVPLGGDANALTGVLGGHVDLALVNIATILGKDVNSIAVFDAERVEQLPETPTAKEVGIDFQFNLWGGLIAPSNLPDDALAALSTTCETAVSSQDYAAELTKVGGTPVFKGPDAFKEFAISVSATNGETISGLDLTGN